MRDRSRLWGGTTLSSLLVLLTALLAASAMAAESASTAPANPAGLRLVAEMQPIPLLERMRPLQVDLAPEVAKRHALSARRAVAPRWREIRGVDFHGLSRAQRDVTLGWAPPRSLPPFDQAIVHTEEDGFVVELRGPRLPSRFDIVIRHLTLYVDLDREGRARGDVVVTVRTEIYE